MSRQPEQPKRTAEGEAKGPRPYEQPRILWREPYEPMSFGVSCAKQPGNPPCNSGPTSG